MKRKRGYLILSHFLINPVVNAASSTSLRNYLLTRSGRVAQIEQPFPDSKDEYAYVLKFVEGRLLVDRKYRAVKKPDWLAYLVHPFINIYFLMKFGAKHDCAVACDNLSFLSIYPFKKLGLVKKSVYYSVDYIETRFENKLLNRIYHFLDKFALNNSDENWVVAREQIAAREKNGVNTAKAAPFKIVPIGFRAEDIKIKDDKCIDYYHLVFCGTLRESAGADLPILALPEILKKFPKAHVTFVGGGDKKKYGQLAKELGVSKKVKFIQNLFDHNKLTEILTRASIGLAPYAPLPGSLSINSDPGKIKLYLLCGLPVVTTKVATSHKIIAEAKAGVVVDYNEEEFVKAVVWVLANKRRYMKYKKAAIKLGSRFDSDKIFARALRDV